MGVMPAYGFFIRHARNIAMNNVEVSYLSKETRPAFILDDVKDATFRNVKAQPVEGAPLFVLKNAENIEIKDCGGMKDEMVSKQLMRSGKK
jgi:hypothetical protein